MTPAEQNAQVVERAKLGTWTYNVPATEIIGTEYPVSATILSPTASEAELPAGSVVATPLKVSDFMMVTLEADPNAFTIARATESHACQNLPIGGSTTWKFNMTPKSLGPSTALSFAGEQTLTFNAYMVFGEEQNTCNNTNPMSQRIKSASRQVKVLAVTPSSLWNRFLAYLTDNPGKCLLWLLPGGGGFIAFAKGLKWLIGKLKTQSGSPTPAQPGP